MSKNKGLQAPVEDARKELDPETLKKILDNSYDEIFVTDKNGITIYVNSACERNYGVGPEKFIGQQPGQMADEGYCYPPITPMILRDKKTVTLEQKTITGRRIVTTATPVFDEDGELELIIQNVRDITHIAETKYDLEETLKLVQRYKQEIAQLKKRDLQNKNFLVRSKQMEELLELAETVAPVDTNILILGESGTGKGVMTKYIHDLSERKTGPFITINCAAIPEQLMESELFGYVAGAFTGADTKGKAGLFELANGGTLFLDEIGEIPLRLQAKLLHVIQELKFSRVGGREPVRLDCRIIAATNRNLGKMVRAGEFREDLYYRLKVIEMEIPPLRERPEDISFLVYLFLNNFDKKNKKSHQFSHEALDILVNYNWPGNIRELENLIERLVITTQEPVIEPRHLPKSFQNHDEDAISISSPQSLDSAIEQFEKKLVLKTYKRLGSSYKVAQALKISQSRASRLIRKYSAGEK